MVSQITHIDGYELQIQDVHVEENQNPSNGSSGLPKTQEVESALTRDPWEGPWEVYESKVPLYPRVIGVRGEGVSICTLDAGGVSNPRILARARADAKLIAAAPDLLTAAKAALRYVDNLNEDAPTYATCPDCTSGCVPNKWNEGPCWIHQLERAVRSCEGGQ